MTDDRRSMRPGLRKGLWLAGLLLALVAAAVVVIVSWDIGRSVDAMQVDTSSEVLGGEGEPSP